MTMQFLFITISIVFVLVNMIQATAKVNEHLRKQVEDLKNEVWLLRTVHAESQQEVQNLQKQLRECSSKKDQLSDRLRKVLHANSNSVSRCINCGNQLTESAQKPVIVKKKFSQLKDLGTKILRKKKYRKILDDSLSCISECTAAKVTLYFEDTHTDLTWSEEDMSAHRAKNGIPSTKYSFKSPNKGLILNRTKPVKRLSSLKSHGGIFSKPCKYSNNHVRKVICAMDDNRISQRAYQNIKNACNGHMPGLNQIKEEKAVLSAQLPIIQGEKVNIARRCT